jgi:Tfp pilus assembly protein PilF
VLESTVLNLELYFEHRNYLAAAFLFLPLVVMVSNNVDRRLFVVICAAVLLTLTGFTRYSAGIWSDYDSMVEASAHKAPTSARAQQQYALNLFNAGQYDQAFATIDRAVTTLPGKTELLLTRAVMRCEAGILSAAQFESMAAIVAANPYDARQLDFLIRLSNSVENGSCPEVAATNLQALFSKMLRHPASSDPGSLAHAQVQFLLGLAYVNLDDPAAATQAFRQSLEARPGPGHTMMMAAVFAENGFYAEALAMSDTALERVRSDAKDLLLGTRVSESEIVDFQRRVREAMSDPTSGSEQ